jgi:hypothetical protein
MANQKWTNELSTEPNMLPSRYVADWTKNERKVQSTWVLKSDQQNLLLYLHSTGGHMLNNTNYYTVKDNEHILELAKALVKVSKELIDRGGVK